MNTATEAAARVAAWRAGTATDSPAGPMFTGGTYAVSELTMSGRLKTENCGTICSYSATRYCC